MLRVAAILFLLLCSTARAVNVPVASGTATINSQSPVASQRLTDGSASQCNSPQPGVAAAASVRYASLYFARLIEERPCLTVKVSSAQCTLWSGGYAGFDPAAVSTNLVARSGTANSSLAYGVIAPFTSMTVVAGMTTANANGCGTVSFEVTALQPWATDRPGLTGTQAIGQTLTAHPGKWSTPVTTTLQWRRCPPQAKCEAIPGATGTTYTPTVADADARLLVAETATVNGAAQTSTVASLPTATLVDPSPRQAYTTALADDAGALPTGGQLLGTSNDADTDAWTVQLPFPFVFAGEQLTQVDVTSDGVIAGRLPGGFAGAPANTCLPAGDFGPTAVLAPYWTDLATTGSVGDGVVFKLTGAAPNRVATFSWHTHPAGAPLTPIDFAVELHEADGTVVYRYVHTLAGGAPAKGDDGATIGAQYRAAPNDFVEEGCKTIAVADGKKLTFTPSVPAITGTPAVGQTLTGTPAQLWGGPADAPLTWERCAVGGACSYVGDKSTYVVKAEDTGFHFKLLQTSANDAGGIEIEGPFTDVVPAPAASPTPSPSPVPTASPAPTATPTASPAPTVAPADVTPPVIAGLRLRRQRLRVVTSEPATVTVRIVRRHHRARTLTLRTYLPSLAASRRVRVRAGRVTAQATDAAGNRSAVVRRRVRR